ncbi:iron ascorbate-dependent oxidoreductase [Asimina triloba]
MPSLSEAFRADPVDLNNTHLDLDSMKELPDTHAWPPLDDYPSSDHDSFDIEMVPIIDLTDPDVVTQIGHASGTWGVFQVINHGIPIELLRQVDLQTRRLFSLPPEQKLKAARSPDGVTGYGLARISSFFSKLMWSEGFTIIGSPAEHAAKLWPHDHSQFCIHACSDVMEEYEKEMKKLAGRLMWLMLASLGVTEDDIKWGGAAGDLDGSSAALQLNSYPACPDPNRAMGLAEHTDSPLLTILYQSSSTSGLQVLKGGGSSEWVTVPPMEGTLVVNVGDLLHILSNAHFHSVLHRAVVNRIHQRISVAYLWGPPTHVQIAPLSKLVTANRPPLYRSVTWAEYLSIKAKLFNKALNAVRLFPPPNRAIDTNGSSGVEQVSNTVISTAAQVISVFDKQQDGLWASFTKSPHACPDTTKRLQEEKSSSVTG